jgi:hypothetical protein
MARVKGFGTKTTSRVRSKRTVRLDSTNYIQVTNLSKKDAMVALDLSYVDASSNKKLVHLADPLQPQQAIKLDFANAGINAQVVKAQFQWKFEGIAFGSSQQVAKIGSYYSNLKASLKPDGSEEFYIGLQVPL